MYHFNSRDKRSKSQMDLGKIYFWTASLHGWRPLLAADNFKEVIIRSWQYLSDREMIDVFGFVIMPTHLHAIWRLNKLNGKESPRSSFMKNTAHRFQDMLRCGFEYGDDPYCVRRANKKHEFWQRESLAIELYSRRVAQQKLDYIHRNPISGKWKLAATPAAYRYSSAAMYEGKENGFPFLKNLWDYI